MRLNKLSDMGYVDVTDDIINTAFGKFKILADRKNIFMTKIWLR